MNCKERFNEKSLEKPVYPEESCYFTVLGSQRIVMSAVFANSAPTVSWNCELHKPVACMGRCYTTLSDLRGSAFHAILGQRLGPLFILSGEEVLFTVATA